MMTMEELAEALNKVLEPMEKLAKALSEAFGRRHKSVKHVPVSKMSTYTYKPVVKRNLPYQRRNF